MFVTDGEVDISGDRITGGGIFEMNGALIGIFREGINIGVEANGHIDGLIGFEDSGVGHY